MILRYRGPKITQGIRQCFLEKIIEKIALLAPRAQEAQGVPAVLEVVMPLVDRFNQLATLDHQIRVASAFKMKVVIC